MHTLKLVTIGPAGSGKSTIANFLADATEIPYDYHPTQGVRILEFEVDDVEVNNERISRDIELWDCSGDQKFKHCWSAMRKGVHGVIFVYSAQMQDSSKELKEFYDFFVNGAKLGPNSCVILHFDPDNTAPNTSKIISSSFSNVSHVKCNVEDGGDKLKTDFRLFLSALMTKCAIGGSKINGVTPRGFNASSGYTSLRSKLSSLIDRYNVCFNVNSFSQFVISFSYGL